MENNEYFFQSLVPLQINLSLSDFIMNLYTTRGENWCIQIKAYKNIRAYIKTSHVSHLIQIQITWAYEVIQINRDGENNAYTNSVNHALLPLNLWSTLILYNPKPFTFNHKFILSPAPSRIPIFNMNQKDHTNLKTTTSTSWLKYQNSELCHRLNIGILCKGNY